MTEVRKMTLGELHASLNAAQETLGCVRMVDELARRAGLIERLEGVKDRVPMLWTNDRQEWGFHANGMTRVFAPTAREAVEKALEGDQQRPRAPYRPDNANPYALGTPPHEPGQPRRHA